MLPHRRQEIEAVFEAALDQPQGARSDWLVRRCAEDGELLTQVQALLAAHERASGLLDALPPIRVAAATISTEAERRIGPYRVLRTLGRGGMGVVYLGERDDGQYRRRVAIKLLREGPDAEDLHRRFLAERQILASLDHPNIAQLLEGGVSDGNLPYLVMEFVDGLPITEYCDRRRLDINARLELFRSVCAAVHHAHRNLVLHRDLKPSNILVTDAGRVKLLDFGIAKLLNPALVGTHAPVTRTAFRVMTPEYASPEQVRGESLSTASDVYALGVVLYELLAGHRPYRLTSRSPKEVAELVCEREPERPSSKVMRTEEVPLDDGQTRALTPTDIGAARGMAVERLRHALQGDLDAVVMMALRKEPSGRYSSAEALATDVQRYLDGLPVLAQKATGWYRLRKFVRRRRIEVAASALAGLSLAVGAGVAVWQASVAAQERDRTAEALRESQEIAGFLLGLFEASDPGEMGRAEVTTRDLVRRGALRAEELASQPLVQARMLGVLGRVHQSLGDYAEAQRLSERAVTLQLSHRGESHADVAAAMSQLADVERRRGRFDSAQVLLERALSIQTRVMGPAHAEIAHTLDALSGVAVQRSDLMTAEQRSREALALRRQTLGPDHSLTIGSLVRLSAVLRQRGQVADAERALREALRLRQASRSTTPAALGADLVQLADLLQQDSARVPEAEALYRQALATDPDGTKSAHAVSVSALTGLAGLLERRGALGEAEARLRELTELRGRVYGIEHPVTSAARLHLAGFLRRTGRLDEAEPEYRAVIEVDRRVLGATHPNVAGTLTALAVVLTERGRLSEADSLLAEAIAMRVAQLGPNHILVARSLQRRAQVQIRARAFRAAESLLERALEIVRDQTTPGADAARAVHGTMVELYDAWGRPEKAEHFRRLAETAGDGAAVVPAVSGRR